MKLFKTLGLGLIISGMFLVSCSQSDNSLSTTADDSTIMSIIGISDFSNTEDIEEATSEIELGKTNSIGDRCFTITINDNGTDEFWPRSWSVDYGTENCEGYKGISRRGVVNVSLTDFWKIEGSLRTITYQDFYVNDVKLEGSKTIENTGFNDDGNMTWVRKMTDGKLSYTDGTTTTWNNVRYSELIEGGDTRFFKDDIYLVTGGSNGVRDGVNFSVEITSPLKFIFGCRFPVSGEVTIKIDGVEDTVINYGDGECDKLATKTTGSDVTEIVLSK